MISDPVRRAGNEVNTRGISAMRDRQQLGILCEKKLLFEVPKERRVAKEMTHGALVALGKERLSHGINHKRFEKCLKHPSRN